MLIIGLTGGIGSGKSTVAHLFAAKNVPIIDADIIARELTQKNEPAFLEIVLHFNKDILHEDGNLDRIKLRNIIFNQPKERLWLENLLHPLIQNEIVKQIKKISAPYCIVVIPLLLEVEPYEFIDRVLVIDTLEHLQIKRVRERNQMKESQIQAIMDSQVTRDYRRSKAHDLINNDGVLSDLIPQVDLLHEQYLKISKEKK
ncbi:MAG: dephospho-CoA kinase [Gammaproteobacteria bacterium RIFCSPHIGHO2_12_FULL_38_14]|nr:MAG: dephospho-CoA kinase [Gammaproteobacteria bacterium RIFCSPHIGHO2_12_FULL_38_14]